MTPGAITAALLRRLRFVVPLSRRMPVVYAIERIAGNCEPELRCLHKITEGLPPGATIDVGANQGLYSFALSKIFTRVYAFEPLEEQTVALRAWGHGVEVKTCAVSDVAGTATLFTPVLRLPLLGLTYTSSGFTSLAAENHPHAVSQIEHTVELRPLDSFELPDVRFVKIDVEGNEIAVIKGARATLESWRPTILCEIKAENLPEVRRLLAELSYEEQPIAEIIGRPSTPENHLFVPKAGVQVKG
jgi:FkbM family methyltransferase